MWSNSCVGQINQKGDRKMKLKDIKFEVVKNSAKKGWHLWYAGRGLKKDAQWALLACPLFIITVRY